MDILTRRPSRPPSPWKDRRLQIGGVAAVLLVAGVLMMHRNPEQRLSLPQDLDTEMGLREIGGDPGGLAPGQAIGGYGRAVDHAVGDSLSMARGANRAPTPKELAAREPDWNEALRQVAKGSKKKRRKKSKPKGLIGKLKAMMARWGGSSGGSGSGMNLSAPSSKGFQLARRTGPGKFGRVNADSAYRSVYGNGSRDRPSRKKANVGVSGFLASAAGKARSMFGGGAHSSAARGPIQPGGGGVSADGRVAPPGIPDPGEGKPVEDVKDNKKKNDDNNDTSEEDKQKALIDTLTNAIGSGAGGGGKWSFGGKKRDGGDNPARSGIPVGVSGRGMDSDAEAAEAFGKTLVDAAETHLASNPPKYNADGLLNASEAKEQVEGIKPYTPEGVNEKVAAARGTTPPEGLTPVPEMITTELSKLPAAFQPRGEPRAVALANETRAALSEYHKSVETFQNTLVASASTVSELSGAANGFSEELVALQGSLQKTTKRLADLKTPLRADSRDYGNAAPEARATYVQRAQGRIDAYLGEASPVYPKAKTLNSRADSGAADAGTRYTSMLEDIARDQKAVIASRQVLQEKYAALSAEIGSIAAEQRRLPQPDPYMNGLAGSGEDILSNVRGQMQKLSKTYEGYTEPRIGIVNGGLAVNEAWKGLDSSPG